jgi:hypothetical protein
LPVFFLQSQQVHFPPAWFLFLYLLVQSWLLSFLIVLIDLCLASFLFSGPAFALYLFAAEFINHTQKEAGLSHLLPVFPFPRHHALAEDELPHRREHEEIQL